MKTNTVTIALVANDDPESRQAGEKIVTKVRGRQSQGKDKRSGDWRPSLWLDVEAWQGSFAQKDLASLRKGDSFTVTGRLTVREWESDNGKREFWGIRADSVDAPHRADGDDGYRGGSATKHHEQNSRGGGYKQPEQPYDADGEPGVPF